MEFNDIKCLYLHIGIRDLGHTYTMETQQGECEITKVDREKDLGVTIDKNLSFREHHHHHMSPAKRICVFEHPVMTNFNCACPAIQRGQGSGFLSEGSS